MPNSEVFDERLYNASVGTRAHEALRGQSEFTSALAALEMKWLIVVCRPPLPFNESFEHTR